jgi:hypothetical protein
MTRTSQCCRTRIAGAVALVRTPDDHLQFTGLSTCGSQDCPVCAAKILARRAEEIKHACTEWRHEGCHVYMLTLTVRHALGDDLKWIRTQMSAAYSGMWKGRAGMALSQHCTREHHIKSTEVTFGSNGYHPHYHVLMFTTDELTDVHKREMLEAWKHQVSEKLGASHVPDDAHGIELSVSHDDNYISKMGLEVAGITMKAAKGSNLTMWQVADCAAGGQKWARRVWHEYVKAMHGARRQVWSQGAKRYFGIKHLSDQAIAEAPIGDKQGPLYVAGIWLGTVWDSLCRSNEYWVTRVVHAATRGSAGVAELPKQLDWTVAGHLVTVREPLPAIPTRRSVDGKFTVRGACGTAREASESVELQLMKAGGRNSWFVRRVATGSKPGRVIRVWKYHGSAEGAAIDYATHWRTKPGSWCLEVWQGLFGTPERVEVHRTECGAVGLGAAA